jgi:hypothetical protein
MKDSITDVATTILTRLLAGGALIGFSRIYLLKILGGGGAD